MATNLITNKGSNSGKYVCKIEALKQANSGSNYLNIFGRGPSSQFFTGGFTNLPQTYPQYQRQPDKIVNNGLFVTPNDGYYPSRGNIPLKFFQKEANNFGSTALLPNQNNFRQYFGQNAFSGVTEYPSNLFGVPVSPNSFNFGKTQEQHQSTLDFNQKPFPDPIPYRKYKPAPEVTEEFEQPSFQLPQRQINSYQQGLPELTEKPFGIKMVPNNSPFGQNLRPLPLAQMPTIEPRFQPKENRNQFFPAPQPTPSAFYHQANIPEHSAHQSGAYKQQNSRDDYKYQKIEDIKAQVDDLQNIINSLNKADYMQTPEDKQTVFSLERQINELKGIINGLNQELASNQEIYTSNLPVYDQYKLQQEQHRPDDSYAIRRKRRSLNEDNQIALDDDPKLYTAVSSLTKLFFDKENERNQRNSNYDDVQKRIVDLKSQLENHFHPLKTEERSFNPNYASNTFTNSYQPPYFPYNNQYRSISLISDNHEVSKLKKPNFMTSIILKVFDGLLAATPGIIEKLFGTGLTELINFGDYASYENYHGGYNAAYHDQSNIQTLFRSLGNLAYGPLVVLKIIDGFTVFINILKKNKFLKNILLPALILLFVAGAVLFLIWWLQPNEHPQISNNNYNQNYDQYGHSNYQNINGYNNGNNYAPSSSYNYPAYSRSYFENGQRGSSPI